MERGEGLETAAFVGGGSAAGGVRVGEGETVGP